MRFLRLLLTACAAALFLRVATAAEVPATPTSLPGAETFAYRDADPRLLLHVFKPKGWQKSDTRPALIFFFGGAWVRGTPEKSASWAKYAASLGLVGIAPDYRTRERFDSSPLDSVADARASLRWIQEHAAELGIDPARIVVGGNSAGAHLALWTAISQTPPGSSIDEAPLQPPAALILVSAPSDTSMLSAQPSRRFGSHAVALSPLHQLDARMPPVIAFHGDADRTVPFSQATALRDALLASGNTCELVVIPNGTHSFTTQFPEWREKSRTRVAAFLKAQNLLPQR